MSSLQSSPRRPLGERFADFLQSRGMRKTRQRELILQAITAQDGPFDADQLITSVPGRGTRRSVSRPTVYRTLAEFVEAGLLRKFDLNGRSLFAIDTDDEQNDHMYCCECHQLYPFHSAALVDLRNQVAAENQFQVESHRLVIIGICGACRQKKRRTRKRVDLI